MNILLFGLLAYFAVRMFRRFRGSQDNTERQQTFQRYDSMSRNENTGWDNLRSREQEQGAEAMSAETALPSDFDQDEFLRGAKAVYTRLQNSWDRRDLDDIANFATEDVLRELRAQAKEDPAPGKTEILLVNASVVEVRDEGNLRRVAVYFDVLMRENQQSARPEQVREVWHFVCSRSEGDSWKLDGIQQLA